jgi:hypothetical protein
MNIMFNQLSVLNRQKVEQHSFARMIVMHHWFGSLLVVELASRMKSFEWAD